MTRAQSRVTLDKELKKKKDIFEIIFPILKSSWSRKYLSFNRTDTYII